MASKSDSLILVVDDEDEIRELIAEYLEMRGYRVVRASSGTEALKVMDANPTVNLILTDIRMPGGDGVSLLKSLRTKDSSCPIVVMMTAFADFSESQALANGANGYLRKPFDVKELMAKVDSFFNA